MTNKEAAKLLSLIKAAYPNSYRDMDDASKRDTVKATVNMWQTAFPNTPYTILEMAFNQFRMVSKFPPTVAEMWNEIERLYWRAIDGLIFAEQFGQKERAKEMERIIEQTGSYRLEKHLGPSGEVGANRLPDHTRVETPLLKS